MTVAALHTSLKRSSVLPGVLARRWDARLRSIVPEAPESKKLERHVRLYGLECGAETMAASGVKELPLVAYATKHPEGRRMAPELHQWIHDLEERGSATDAVARTLNLELARVQRVLREPPAA